jgi:hypothetical protein
LLFPITYNCITNYVILQGATIVKLVNAQGGAAGHAAKIVTNVKSLGSNVMTMAKPGNVQMVTSAAGSVGGKQTFVINKAGGGMGTTLKGPGGQQIIVVSSGGGLKTIQALTTAQAGAHGSLRKTNVIVFLPFH